MTPHSAESPDRTDADRTASARGAGRARRVLSRLSRYRSSGTLAMLAGGALLARAVRSGRRSRTLVQGLLGAALLTVGLRQRLSTDAESAPATGPRYTEATASEGTDEPAGETTTTEDLVRDPRQDEGRGADGVDVSEDAMAAEPAEATGPEPSQSQPTQTEDTEPEASPEEDASHVETDVGHSGGETERDGGSRDESTDEGHGVSTDSAPPEREGGSTASGQADEESDRSDAERDGPEADEPGTGSAGTDDGVGSGEGEEGS